MKIFDINKMVNFHTVPNYNLYRIINELRDESNWYEIILLAEQELTINRDFSILARLIEAICILYGINGLTIILDWFNVIKWTNFLPENNMDKIFSWINNNLLNWLFQNDEFFQCTHRDLLLIDLVDRIPKELFKFHDNVRKYLHKATEAQQETDNTIMELG